MLFSETATATLPPTFEMAAEVEDVYTRYYSYAAPFAPDALYRPWLRCRDDGRCASRALTLGRQQSHPAAAAHPG